jgi:integrase
MDVHNFRRRTFRKILEKADVPQIRIHDIRHTFASLLLAAGEPLHYVKDQLGHAAIQTTVDVYGHIVPGSNRNAVNRLDDEKDSGLKMVKGVA